MFFRFLDAYFGLNLISEDQKPKVGGSAFFEGTLFGGGLKEETIIFENPKKRRYTCTGPWGLQQVLAKPTSTPIVFFLGRPPRWQTGFSSSTEKNKSNARRQKIEAPERSAPASRGAAVRAPHGVRILRAAA